jgi:hypothetical protein
MFSYFWVPLSDEYSEFSQEMFESSIADAFNFIIGSIDWKHLEFYYLFNSYTIQPITGNLEELKQICARLLLRHKNVLNDIAIIYRKQKVVHTTFSPSVTRALAFGMMKKFKYLFLHHPKADKSILTWIIGLYTDMNGLESLYQPVIYINDTPHLLVAFKLKHFKIVLTLNPNAQVDIPTMKEIPKYLKELRTFLSEQQTMNPSNDVPIPFALAIDDQHDQQLYFDSSQIEARSRHAIDTNIIRGNQANVDFGNVAAVAFPGIDDYYVYVVRNGPKKVERVVTCKNPSPKISDTLKICNRICCTRNQTATNTSFCLIA